MQFRYKYIVSEIVLLVGKAGSGKDTVAEHIVKRRNAVAIAQADPLKRFAMDVFEFTEHQLWGPSQARNQRDPRFDWLDAGPVMSPLALHQNFTQHAPRWLDENLPAWFSSAQREDAAIKLRVWFRGVVDTLLDEKGLTPRGVLQTLGTEFGRAVCPTMWADRAVETAKQLLSYPTQYHRVYGIRPHDKQWNDLVVLTDGRFANELDIVHDAGGAAWGIQRPGSSLSSDAMNAGVAGHTSETSFDDIPHNSFDLVIVNDGTLADLYRRVDVALDAFFPRGSR